jgi:hypothetical protein
VLLLAVVILTAGCVTVDNIQRLNMGMSKSEVKKIMGSPDSVPMSEVKDSEPSEIWYYKLYSDFGYQNYYLAFDGNRLMLWERRWPGAEPNNLYSLRKR